MPSIRAGSRLFGSAPLPRLSTIPFVVPEEDADVVCVGHTHLPYVLEVGDKLEKGEPFGELESVETISELIAPVSGTVLAVNTELEDHPSLINEDPYNEGWLIEMRLKDESEIELLMDMDEYYHFVGRPDPQ